MPSMQNKIAQNAENISASSILERFFSIYHTSFHFIAVL
jgi:hypothetical protein